MRLKSLLLLSSVFSNALNSNVGVVLGHGFKSFLDIKVGAYGNVETSDSAFGGGFEGAVVYAVKAVQVEEASAKMLEALILRDKALEDVATAKANTENAKDVVKEATTILQQQAIAAFNIVQAAEVQAMEELEKANKAIGKAAVSASSSASEGGHSVYIIGMPYVKFSVDYLSVSIGGGFVYHWFGAGACLAATAKIEYSIDKNFIVFVKVYGIADGDKIYAVWNKLVALVGVTYKVL